VGDKFGSIPTYFWVFTRPGPLPVSAEAIGDLVYFVFAIVFVAAVESLLCSRMADRLANNTGMPYNPDKELWGQGWVMAIVPLLNGFPHTGALARTATNIKLGAVSPLAGIFKAVLKLALAFYLARYLELVPMACIGGVLLYVATNMVKRSEVTEVFALGRAHVWLMVFTAVGVIALDFLRGVLAALLVYGIWQIVVHSRTSAVKSHTLGIYERSRGAPRASAHLPQLPMDGHGAEPPRAVVDTAGRAGHDDLVSGRRAWLSNIRRPGSVSRSAFVHGQANVVGRVVLGDYVHIAAGASVRADEGTPFFIGSNSNIQDGVVIHALKNKQVLVDGQAWAVYIGRNVSMAHDALIHGPCYVGDHTFVGFKAVVHDAVVGAHCFLGIGAVVAGVEIPDGRFVPNGAIVDTSDKVARLAPVADAHRHFNADVVEVNRGLAAAYREHTQRGGLPGGPVLRISEQEQWAPPAPVSNRF
jgi:SulP family sulfate permease